MLRRLRDGRTGGGRPHHSHRRELFQRCRAGHDQQHRRHILGPAAGAPASECSATIDWGGGSSSSAGTVSGSSGSFTVSGEHSYVTHGNFTVTVTDLDDLVNTATVTDSAAITGVGPS